MKYSKAYSEPIQTSKMERFAKIVYGKKSWTIFVKRSILAVWHDSKYNSGVSIQEIQISSLTGIIGYCY